MSWKLGQTIFSISQGRIGILLKVHESDGLLAVKVAPKEAYGWAITDCLPVDETTSEWQQWRRGQIVYWGMEGRHGKIIGWEQDHKQIIVQVDQYYIAVQNNVVAHTVMDAKRIAWLYRWGPADDPANKIRRKEWIDNNQWEEIALYLELLNDCQPLLKEDAIQMAAAWRRCGKPIRALQAYSKARTQFIDGEALILAGMGGCYRDLGLWNLARATYHELIQRYPQNEHKAAAALGLSGIAADQGNQEEFSRWQNQAKQWNPAVILQQRPRLRTPHASITQKDMETLLATVDPDA